MMTARKFITIWYTGLAGLLLIACSVFLGQRDTIYQGDKGLDVTQQIISQHSDWWDSTLMIRLPDGKPWCSAACVNNTDWLVDSPISWLVTARHCTDKKLGSASILIYGKNGKVEKEIKYPIINYFEHKSRDFAVLVVKGRVPTRTNVYIGELPINRIDYIIGYRGSAYGDFYEFGKYVNSGWADKGQSGGGVFSPNLGLHSIVSTHVDGVNIYKALVDMNLTRILNIDEKNAR